MSASSDPENPTEAEVTPEATATAEATVVEETTEPTVEEQLAAAQAEAKANYDRYLRATADLENYRRRMIREKDELRQFASSRVLEDLMPVLDNLSLGLAAAKAPTADLANLVSGIGMVETQLQKALSDHGLTKVDPVGGAFDPNLHEALSQQPSADKPEGDVLQVIRVGYSLNGRLLRPASVIVSSGPAEAPVEESK